MSDLEPLNLVEIVLVEDSDEDAELTMRALRRSRLANRVHRVSDGEQALELFFGPNGYASRGERPRVVLLDLKLPKVGGLEVLRAIKNDPRTALTPVAMLTSSAEDRDLEECYRLGANSYIVKPVGVEAFLRTVEQLGLYWAVLNQPVR